MPDALHLHPSGGAEGTGMRIVDLFLTRSARSGIDAAGDENGSVGKERRRSAVSRDGHRPHGCDRRGEQIERCRKEHNEDQEMSHHGRGLLGTDVV